MREKGEMHRDRVAIASLVVTMLLALGSWEQIWKGATTFAATPLARWALIALAGCVLFAAVASFLVALVKFVRKLKHKIDTRRRVRDDLQASALLHQEVLLVLTSVFEDDRELHEAVARARERIQEKEIVLDELSSATSFLEELDPQLNTAETEEFQEAWLGLATVAQKLASLEGSRGQPAGKKRGPDRR